MKIEIQSPHFKVSKSLTELVKKKIRSLSIAKDSNSEVEVLLTFDYLGKSSHQVCLIRLSVDGREVLGKGRADSFEKAVTDCVDSIKQKLSRKRVRLTAHKARPDAARM